MLWSAVTIGLILTQSFISASAQDSCAFTNNGTNYFEGFSSELKYAKGFSYQIGTNTISVDAPTAGLSLFLYMCNLPTPPTVNNRIPIRIPITGAQIAGSGVLTFIQRIGMGPLIASSERLVNSDSCLTLPSNAQTVPAGFYSFNSSLTNAFTREANPLAIGEWIKFFGLFFGPDGMRNAQTEFTKMDNTFQCITSATSAYRTRVTPDKYPVIGAYQANNGVVERVVDEMDWIGLGLAAGANFSVLPTSSAPLATWKDLAKTVDVVFDFSNPENDAYDMKTFLKNYGLPDAQQGVYPFLDNTNSKVFRYDLQRHNSSGVVDYDQARYAQPDLLLAELIYIMDPSFNRAYRPYWFEALNNAPGVPPRTCPVNRAWTPYLDGVYCNSDWKFEPVLRRLTLGSPTSPSTPSASSTEFKGSGASSSGSTLTPVGIVFIIAGVLAVAAGVVVAFLFLKGRKSGSDRRFFRLGNGDVLANRRGDDLNNGITLQDMT